MNALDSRYGSKRPFVITSLRSNLSVIRQEEEEHLETFGDRVLTLPRRAYQGITPELNQALAIPAFPRGIKDKIAGEEAMQFGKPRTVVEAVEQVIHLQCTARAVGKSPYSTRQVVFVMNHQRSALISLLALTVPCAGGSTSTSRQRHTPLTPASHAEAVVMWQSTVRPTDDVLFPPHLLRIWWSWTFVS